MPNSLLRPKSITPREFARRRAQLMRAVGPDSIVIMPAAAPARRNSDVLHPYRQNSDFFYLTGFNEPDAIAVLVPGRAAAQYILFVRDRDPKRELWDGLRAGPNGAIEHYGADDAFPICDIDEILPGLLENRARVFYPVGVDEEFDRRMHAWVNGLRALARLGRHPPYEFIAIQHALHDMRLFKSPAEVALMRVAAQIAARAHIRAMRCTRPGCTEYELMAELLYEFRLHNADISYQPIVGGGANGCILHYQQNDQPLRDGDLVLVDAGCEQDCYASDITRTWPVNGTFSPEQRVVYSIVLAANHAAIAKARAGCTWNEPHEAAVREITQGLVKLGLLKGRVPQLIRDEAYKKFFMHRTGHWLGMDVHDVGDYKIGDQWRVLEPGMALTIEPGIYIAPNALDVPKRFRGIGIRIEDDVVVTRGEAQVLTNAVPKEVTQIEKLMAAA
jgi:Xaa-Pro aminopeptidase